MYVCIFITSSFSHKYLETLINVAKQVCLLTISKAYASGMHSTQAYECTCIQVQEQIHCWEGQIYQYLVLKYANCRPQWLSILCLTANKTKKQEGIKNELYMWLLGINIRHWNRVPRRNLDHQFRIFIVYIAKSIVSLKSALILHGHCSVTLKTMFTDCFTVCSKGCLLMSEPMRQRERGQGDKVRAASHASWP